MGRPPTRRDERDEPSERGDEQEGGWSRAMLKRMDARFVERVERAISKGREHCLRHDEETAQAQRR